MYVYIYIYIYREREREKERDSLLAGGRRTPALAQKAGALGHMTVSRGHAATPVYYYYYYVHLYYLFAY